MCVWFKYYNHSRSAANLKLYARISVYTRLCDTSRLAPMMADFSLMQVIVLFSIIADHENACYSLIDQPNDSLTMYTCIQMRMASSANLHAELSIGCDGICIYTHTLITLTSAQARLPAELKHITKRRKRN